MKKAVLPKAQPTARAGSLDPRSRRTRETVLNAAMALMHDRGYGGCTIEAIVELTGVAKTTIYRHWPGRAELLSDAVSSAIEKLDLPDTGTLRGDLVEFFTVHTHHMERDRFNQSLQTVAGLIEASKRDPALIAVTAQMVAGLVQTVRIMLERAKARGEISRKPSLEVLTNLMLGAIFVQRAFLDKPLTDQYVANVVDALLDGARATRTNMR